MPHLLTTLFTGRNRKFTIILLPGMHVAGVFCYLAIKPFWEGYRFYEGVFFNVPFFSGLLFIASAITFICGVVVYLYKDLFTKKWAFVYVVTFLLWWVNLLPLPGYTDGMKRRLQSDVPEAALLAMAKDARSRESSSNIEWPAELARELQPAHPFIHRLTDSSPSVHALGGGVDILWEYAGNGGYGIRILDQPNPVNPFPKEQSSMYQEIRRVYSKVWVFQMAY